MDESTASAKNYSQGDKGDDQDTKQEIGGLGASILAVKNEI